MGVKILVYIGHRFLEKPYQWASITILKTPFEHNCYFIFLKNHSFSAAMTLRLLLNVCSEKQMLKCWTPNDVWMWATWIEFLHFPKFKGDTSQCPLCEDTTGGHYLWPWKQALGRPSNPVHRCSDLGLHFSSLPTTHISAAYFLLGQNSQEKKLILEFCARAYHELLCFLSQIIVNPLFPSGSKANRQPSVLVPNHGP